MTRNLKGNIIVGRRPPDGAKTRFGPHANTIILIIKVKIFRFGRLMVIVSLHIAGESREVHYAVLRMRSRVRMTFDIRNANFPVAIKSCSGERLLDVNVVLVAVIPGVDVHVLTGVLAANHRRILLRRRRRRERVQIAVAVAGGQIRVSNAESGKVEADEARVLHLLDPDGARRRLRVSVGELGVRHVGQVALDGGLTVGEGRNATDAEAGGAVDGRVAAVDLATFGRRDANARIAVRVAANLVSEADHVKEAEKATDAIFAAVTKRQSQVQKYHDRFHFRE